MTGILEVFLSDGVIYSPIGGKVNAVLFSRTGKDLIEYDERNMSSLRLVCFRPEINVRHTAFRRGSAYLERYCMLITFDVYLEEMRDRNKVKLTFEEWMAARPEILAARDALHQNPAGALAPAPPAKLPHMWLTNERHNSSEASCTHPEHANSFVDQVSAAWLCLLARP